MRTKQDRIKEIQRELTKYTNKDIQSLYLYQEAVDIFREIGNTKSEALCLKQVDKIKSNLSPGQLKEMNSRSILPENGTSGVLRPIINKSVKKSSRQVSICSSLNKHPTSKSILQMFKSTDNTSLSKCHLPNLPTELLLLIFKGVDNMTILKLCRTCKYFKTRLESNTVFWTDFNYNSFTERMINQDFIRIWSLNRGLATKLMLTNPKRLTAGAINGIQKVLPKKLVECSMRSAKFSAASIVTLLSNNSLRSTLTKLTLTNMATLDNNTLGKILMHLTSIKYLDISGCVQITDSAFDFVPKNANKQLILESVSVRECKLTDIFVEHLVKLACTTLKSLDVYDCQRITQRSIASLSNFIILESIELTGLQAASASTFNDACNAFITKCVHLKRESVQDSHLILISELQDLMYVQLNGCKAITNSGILKLINKQGVPFKLICLNNNIQLNSDALDKLKQKFGKSAITATIQYDR
ncbi:hypothetical protein HDV02_003763 [Globomyces sp. JEL0801]|nr:hypothetical protein HDV02_003763 [Globomyces sp. JEL0801]